MLLKFEKVRDTRFKSFKALFSTKKINLNIFNFIYLFSSQAFTHARNCTCDHIDLLFKTFNKSSRLRNFFCWDLMR